MKQTHLVRAVATCVGMLLAQQVQALPVVIDYAGFWLDNNGVNTLGIAGGGSPGGLVTTLFVAKTTPDYYNGTTATVEQNGVNIGTLGLSNISGLEWARRTPNPGLAQLAPLTVTFSNGADTAQFVGRDLSGLVALPLVMNLALDTSVDAWRPTVSWSLPANPGSVDLLQLVFYDNANNVEVGTRVNLAATATSYTFASLLPPDYDLTISVRLVDLYDNSLPRSPGNISRESRAYINYFTPSLVPEPATWTMMVGGMAALGACARRRRAPA